MNTNNLSGFSPELRNYLNSFGVGLPPIRGTWFVVDPYGATYATTGGQPGQVVTNFLTAYNLCTTGVGDGILVLSGGTTTAQTTSYLSSPLVWTKTGITVFGVAAPTRQFGRARIANLVHTTGALTSILTFTQGSVAYDKITRSSGSFITDLFAVGDKLNIVTTGAANNAVKGCTITAVSALTLTLDTIGTLQTEAAGSAQTQTITSYCNYLIDIQGDNNILYNIEVANFDDNPLAIEGLKVSGDRNYCKNIHSIGAGALPADRTATVNDNSLHLVGAQDNTFENCTIGTDMTDRGGTASGDIRFTVDGVKSCERNRFINCEIQSYNSTGTGHGAIKTDGATACRRDHIFEGCLFRSDTTAQAVVLIGTACTEGKFYMVKETLALNYTAWEAGSGNMSRVSAPAAVASGGGGLVVVGTET
jgi:hypothetical protein